MYSERGLTSDRAIALMAVAAVLLAIALASSLGGGETGGPPEASFVFDRDGTTVVVTHFGGDPVDGDRLYVVSRSRGSLGNVAGTDGRACERNLSKMERGDECRVPETAYERLLVVWRRGENDSHVLARRDAAPTPTPTPSPTPPPTPTPTPGQPPVTTATPGPGPTTSAPTPTTTVTATPETATGRTGTNRTTAPPTGETTAAGTATPG